MLVTPETAMGIGAIRACVTLLAESIAQLPVELYQRDEKAVGAGQRIIPVRCDPFAAKQKGHQL